MILVIAEQQDGALNKSSWETIAAAQQVGGPVKGAVLGADTAAAAGELAAADVAEVLRVEAPALAPYTLDGFVSALAQVVAAEQPRDVYLPHTYQTRDFAPALAVTLGRALVTDCVAAKQAGGRRLFARPVFQGRLLADAACEGPALATFQIGAVRADTAARGAAPAHAVLIRLAIFISVGIAGITFFKQVGAPVIAFAEIALLIESIILFTWLSNRVHEPLIVWSAVSKGVVAALIGGVTAYGLAVIIPGSAVLTALLGMVVGGLVCIPIIWSEIKLLLKL